ncbi:disease resistance protein RUN1-like [Eucalyptus grandis]|uniref:disease resistance protein RUN1-like n=1 Tax=Eucalyptus grandis TaxID=71139 RepID=UPI00192EAE4D|nr:disease resistance protein RUN1-like [Eucalyptus grandis]
MICRTFANVPTPNQMYSRPLIANSGFRFSFSPRKVVQRSNRKTLKVCIWETLRALPTQCSQKKFDWSNRFHEDSHRRKRLQSSYSDVGESCDLSSYSSSDLPGVEYEVFLSFRGPDTRKKFVDCLYTRLVDAGIRAFRDNDELPVGGRISLLLQAIKNSKICIPIFSKDYAESEWCLLELAQMVECSKLTGLEILPLFYDVDPSDVKLNKGPYLEALHKHKKKHKPNLVHQWEEALKEVGKIKGWELEKDTNGLQGKLIDLILRKVLVSLKVHHLNVTDELVAIDDHMDKLMRMLNVGSNDVRIIGIHGMGGIGKTTLAKVVFNQLSSHFEYCSFLTDVRETSQNRGLEFLQNQLISHILQRKGPEITNVDEGINTIKERFSGKEVLILLDDVDERAQLNALAGRSSWFGPGSRIIVTTRNIDVLNVPEMYWKYELEGMDADRSIHLFSRHAFRRDRPPDDYLTYSKKVVDFTGGLPLALETIGSFLSRKTKKVWEDTLKKLEKVPRDEVEKKLRISYNALDHWQKQIFLDIACLFIGFDKRIVVHLWDEADFFPEEGIEVLRLMSLIKIGDDNKLWMHDQLRDLGREIVRQEGNMEFGRRSRIWNHEEALHTLINHKGTEMVEALRLKFDSKSQYYLTQVEFSSLSNLRFLQVNGENLAGNFENLLPQLRWLCWHYCPSNFLPTNFYLRNLVILDLSWSKISEYWEGWHQIKMSKNLKVLNLTGCTCLYRNPDFSPYEVLEILILEGCESLIGIDASIGGLKQLVSLNMKDCHSIQELPENLASMEALTELIVDGTSVQEIFIMPGGMKKLETLSARDCKSLTQIRSSISQLESLTYLALDNAKITRLPASIGELVKLERLSLKGCRSINKLPDTIGQLESLVELDLSSTGITELPDSISNLKKLRVLKVEGSYIEQIPVVIGMLEKLEEIHAKGCNLEGDIPSDIGELAYLRILSLSDNRICSLPETICRLSHLQTLDLELCKELKGLPELPNSLINLRVSSQSMEKIPNLSNLINLRHLYLSDGSHLHGFPTNDPTKLVQDPNPMWLGMLSKLETLQLSLSKITTLPADLGSLYRLKKLVLSCVDLQSFTELPSSLSTLYIGNCKSMTIVPDLSNLRNLSELELLHSAISEIQGLEGLESLQVFDVIYCKLKKLDGLEQLKSLRRLVLRNCESLDRLPNLSNLKKLKEFKLRDCEKLLEIQGLDKLVSLEELQISDCRSIRSLPDLSNLKKMKVLEIKNCDKIKDIGGLDRLVSLEGLQISECRSLERLPNLSNLENLKDLEIENCEKVTDIEGLDQLESLENLRIIGCKSVEKLPDLSNFKSLKSLYIEDCEEIREIVGLGISRSIKRR